MCIKKEKKQHMQGYVKETYILIYKENKYNVCQKWSQDLCTRINVSKIEKRKRYM